MNISRKWGMVAGTVLVSAGLLAGGAVYAATNPSSPAPAQPSTQNKAQSHLDSQVKEGKLTQAEADLLKQLGDLRQSYMQKYKADAQGIINQAVKDGKITQDQATKLQQRWQGHGKMGKHGKDGAHNLTLDQLKSKLDQAVKDGKLTQQQADQMIQRWTVHQQKQQEKQQQAQPQNKQ